MQFTRNVLKNGLRIITVPMHQSASVTVLVLTSAGSEYETKRTNGLSHFLEHMCFKGTASRSTPREIVEEIEGIGGRSNAFTGLEETGYYIKAEARHFKKALDIVSDIFLNPIFPKKEIEKERGVIIQEIGKSEDEPSDRVFDLFMSCLYGNQGAGWDILGTRGTVKSLQRKDFVAYRKRYYTAKNTVVVVAGNVGVTEVVREVTRAFAGIPEGKAMGKPKTTVKRGKPRIRLAYKKSSQTHFVLGFHSYPVTHPRRIAAEVLGAALGGGSSSRLFQRIREEMGAAYAVNAGSESYLDHGEFFVYAGIGHDGVADVIRVTLEEIDRFRKEKISADELERVKNYIAGGLATGLETGSRLAEFYGREEVLRQELLTPKEVADKVHRVTADDIEKAAREIFRNEHLCLATIGPIRSAAGLSKILRLP
ncbi:MAG: insulinase family protein [Parcubacteria group bacterium]|nr:insulinase family protein [Parcubacteria group bacterium]